MFSSKMIYSLEGVKGFWRGTLAAQIKLITSSGIYFGSLH
jgi:hypothetical protein